MKATFRGGIHVKEYKNTSACPIEILPTPAVLKIPLSQHIGAPANAVVSVGDRVLVGQKIADVAPEKLGCPIHTPISGTVKEIIKKTLPSGAVVEHIVIENDGLDELSESCKPYPKPLDETTPDEIIDLVREAGIIGMGGASFPTYAKIRSAIGKADTIIVNCAECEPFITADHRLLLERSDDIVGGIEVYRRALGCDAIIAIEDNKPDAIAFMQKKLADNKHISVKVMKTKYPQGDERQLIFALTGREIPTGKLPADVGCVIFNAATCASAYRAFSLGMPSLLRTVTVDGDCVKNPKNLLIPIGTSAAEIIAYCGGLKKVPKKLITGGPMMGMSQWDSELSTTKSMNALLVFSEDFGKKKISNATCIHCGKCVNHCPMHIMPMYIAQFSKAGDYARAEEYGAMSCVECGSCSYTCPGGVEIVQHIRVAKAAIRTERARIAALQKK